MSNDKQAPIKPMPFPGESPTVALAMAAGQKYGLHEEAEQKPKRPARRAATKKKAAAPKKRSAAPKRKAAAPKRKAAASGRKPAKRAATAKGMRKGR